MPSTFNDPSYDRRFKDAYQRYLDQGWQPIPLPYKQKKTPPKGVTGRSGTYSHERIDEWLLESHWANGNTAVRGSGWIGLDEDNYGSKEGTYQLQQIEAELGVDLPKTFYSTSRGIGQTAKIRYYKVPPGFHFIGNAATDVEIVQESYRYAVVWPSIHSTTGQMYKWYSADGVELEDIPAVADMAELPQAFIDIWIDHGPRRDNFSGIVDYNVDDVDMAGIIDSLTEGEPSTFLLNKLPADWEDGRFSTQNQTLWAFAREVIFRPDEPGQRQVFERIVEARATSDSATTPVDQRISDIQRSFRGAIAKWQAEKDMIPQRYLEYSWGKSADASPANPDPVLEAEVVPGTDLVANTEITVPMSTPVPVNNVAQENSAQNPPPTEPPVPPTTPPAPGAPAHDGSFLDLADGPLADLLSDTFATRFCWTIGRGWMEWDGKIWRKRSQPELREAVHREFELLYKAQHYTYSSDPKRLAQLVVLKNKPKMDAVSEMLKGLLTKDDTDFDNAKDFLNVANGMVDLRTKTLYAHDPRYLFTKVAKVGYYPNYRHADWEKAQTALPEDVNRWMQLRLGQAATGYKTNDDIMPICVGGGENGKTTYFGAVFACLGDFATNVPDKVLISNPGDHTTELTTLLGARLAVMEETPEARYLDVKRLKTVLGSNVITARYIAKDNISWIPTHSLFITTNFVPQIAENDRGTWRRLALVLFPFTFIKPYETITRPEQLMGDPTLRDRIANNTDHQLEAVLSWVVDGAAQWYANGQRMDSPGSVLKATDDWKNDSDHVGAYVADNIDFDPSGMVSVTDMLKDFTEWSRETANTNNKWSSQTFATRFLQLESVIEARITKKKAGTNNGIDRPNSPDYMLPALPAKPWVWVGIKFKPKALPPGGLWEPHD